MSNCNIDPYWSTHFVFVLPVPSFEHLSKGALVCNTVKIKLFFFSFSITYLANFCLLFIFGHFFTIGEVKLLNVLVPELFMFLHLFLWYYSHPKWWKKIYFEKLLPWLEPAISRLDHYLKQSSSITLFSTALTLFLNNTTLEFQHITSVLSFEDKKAHISNVSGTFNQNIFLIRDHIWLWDQSKHLCRTGGFPEISSIRTLETSCYWYSPHKIILAECRYFQNLPKWLHLDDTGFF